MADVAAALVATTGRLAVVGVETPGVDAELLLGHVLGLTRTAVRAALRRPLTPAEGQTLDGLVERRARREPLAYVLGEWGFRRIMLLTDARALVPRPETEIVVDRCLERVRGIVEPDVLDVGVGSGAIALSIAHEHKTACVTALDVSSAALDLARENSERLALHDRVCLLLHDALGGLPPGPYHLVVSNPPYVREGELAQLAPEVRIWEPWTALLDRGQTGAVAAAARGVLRPGGALVLETHGHAARQVETKLDSLGYAEVRLTRDLGGRERVVEATWPG